MTDPFKMDIEQIMRQLPHRYPFLLWIVCSRASRASTCRP